MPRTLTADFANTGSAIQTTLAEHVRHMLLRRRYRQRLRDLLIMGPHLIADFGMTMEDADREANLPFWRSSLVPQLWPL